jgi:hypothetical protein
MRQWQSLRNCARAAAAISSSRVGKPGSRSADEGGTLRALKAIRAELIDPMIR